MSENQNQASDTPRTDATVEVRTICGAVRP